MIKQRKPLRWLTLRTLLAASMLTAATLPGLVPAHAQTVTNPIYNNADAFMTYVNGRYYMTRTNLRNDISVVSSTSLSNLYSSPDVSVFNVGQFFESPEIYWVGAPYNRWYIYYTRYPNSMEVLESDSANAQGSYHFKAGLTNNTYDGTLLKMPNGQQYLLGSTYGSIVIQPMSNPYTVSGGQATIAVRDQPWEQTVIEVPQPLWHNGQLFLLYTCGGWNANNYAVGVMRFNGGDPMNPGAWTKLPGPFLTGNPGGGAWGAGAASPFTSPDGMENWIIYQAFNQPYSGGDSRNLRVQKINWNADGTPNLGFPVPIGQSLPLPSGDPNGFRQNGVSYSLTNEAANLNLDNPNGTNVLGTKVNLWPANGATAQSWRFDALGGNGVYALTNIAGGLTLDNPNGSNVPGTQIGMWSYNSSNAQQWFFGLQPDGSYSLTNIAANLALDDPNGSNSWGTKLQLWGANGATPQNWKLNTGPDSNGIVSGGVYTLINIAGNLALDNPAGSITAGTQIQLWGANGASAQQWRIDAVGNGIYTLTNIASGALRIDDPNGSNAPGTKLQLWYANMQIPQNWRIQRQSDGNYVLTNVAANLALDNPNGSNVQGTKLQLLQANGATAQRWRLTLQ